MSWLHPPGFMEMLQEANLSELYLIHISHISKTGGIKSIFPCILITITAQIFLLDARFACIKFLAEKNLFRQRWQFKKVLFLLNATDPSVQERGERLRHKLQFQLLPIKSDRFRDTRKKKPHPPQFHLPQLSPLGASACSAAGLLQSV